MVQKMPGGEKMTGYTRILHRTVPDVLMEEVRDMRGCRQYARWGVG
jgi:hypothetical protein